jgi:hypothetical protein
LILPRNAAERKGAPGDSRLRSAPESSAAWIHGFLCLDDDFSAGAQQNAQKSRGADRSPTNWRERI